jgi:hypothetical protein
MLQTVRLLAPLMELRGFTRGTWADDAGVSRVTLDRYLNPRTQVGDRESLDRLLAEAECFVVVTCDGALSDTWRDTILSALAERRAARMRTRATTA